jgi:D-arabinose 1-dehydrogenase-like Zn-dependent alcohol dehydrogenase
LKAMVLHEYGQKLKLENVPTPEVGPNEALVKIAACAIGRLDNWAKLGYMGRGNDSWQKVRLPMILGHQIAGEVVETGVGCVGIQRGDRVVIDAIITCGKCSYCIKMMEPHCAQHTHIGVQADGGFAEYIKVPGGNAIKIPDSISFENATMIPANIGCSWHMLHARGKLKPLESVLAWITPFWISPGMSRSKRRSWKSRMEKGWT